MPVQIPTHSGPRPVAHHVLLDPGSSRRPHPRRAGAAACRFDRRAKSSGAPSGCSTPMGSCGRCPRPATRAIRELREEVGAYLNRLIQAVPSSCRITECEAVLNGAATGTALVEFARRRAVDLVVASVSRCWGLLAFMLEFAVLRSLRSRRVPTGNYNGGRLTLRCQGKSSE